MEERKSRYELFLEEEARKAQPTKECSKCHKVKALGEYHRQQRGMFGVRSVCKSCRGERRKYRDCEDRFWKNYHKRVVRVGNCLEWTGSYHGRYPACNFKGARISVRRLVYSLAIGQLKEDELILASCGNERCVRHSHLLVGSELEAKIKRINALPVGDRHHIHRHPGLFRGERNPSAKLTEDDVRAIRTLYAQGSCSRAELAKQFCVSKSAVDHIATGRKWAHVQ